MMSKLAKIFKMRTPSRAELRDLFWVVLTLTNLWAFFVFAHYSDILNRTLGLGEIVGVLAYVLALAILDTAFAMVMLVVLGYLLPYRLFAERYTARGAFWFLSITIYLYVFFIGVPFDGYGWQGNLMWTGIMLVFGIVSWWGMGKAVVKKAGEAIMERLPVLGWLYLVLDIAGILIVAGRNLFPANLG